MLLPRYLKMSTTSEEEVTLICMFLANYHNFSFICIYF